MEQVEKLKRQLTRTRILLMVFAVLCALFATFAYIQKLEAETSFSVAVQQQKLAEQALQEAMKQEKVAQQERAFAQQHGATAQQENRSVEQLRKQLDEAQKFAERAQANAEASKNEALRQKMLVEKNYQDARDLQAEAIRLQNLAIQNESAAKKALEECQKRIKQ